MSERDEMARVIVEHPWLDKSMFTGRHGDAFRGSCPSCPERVIAGGHNSPSHAGHIAEAILAAGYRKPRTVTTVEELKALEDPDAILVDYKRNAYQWGIGLDGSEGWQSTRDPNPITSDHLWRFTPITVLHEPGQP